MKPTNGFFVVVYYVLGFLLRIIHPTTVEGLEKLPKSGVLLCSNHSSNWDPVLLGTRLPVNYRLHAMAKEELFKNPVLGWIIRKLGAFPVTRGAGDNSAIETAEQYVRSGKVLMIFPEGTRSKDGRVGRGKTGVALIAAQTGAPVVPVGITFEGKLHFRSDIIVRFGKPIEAAELAVGEDPKPRELAALKNRIMTAIKALVDEPALPAAEPEQE